MNRALFLDRDGVVNIDHGHVHRIEDFEFRPEIFPICRAAQKRAMKLVIVTNQAGIARGLYTKQQFLDLSSYMRSEFKNEAIHIDAIYHCPYHPVHGLGVYRSPSYDRKPAPGMLLRACHEHNINPMHSIMIGDNESDKLAAFSAGIRFFVDATGDKWGENALQLLAQ